MKVNDICFELDELISKINLNKTSNDEIKNKLTQINNTLKDTIFPKRKIYIVIDEGFIQGVYSKEEVVEKVVLDGLGKKLLKFWVDDGLWKVGKM